MNAAEITACVANLPETTAIPLTLTRRTATGQSFLRWPMTRDQLPELILIERAVENGQTNFTKGE
jgi:hypothetical protein